MGNAWRRIGLQRVGRGMGLPQKHHLWGRIPALSAMGAAWIRLGFPFRWR